MGLSFLQNDLRKKEKENHLKSNLPSSSHFLSHSVCLFTICNEKRENDSSSHSLSLVLQRNTITNKI